MVPEIWSATDILNQFGSFGPLDNTENQNFEKMKKTPGDIILQKCTIHDNRMMYGSWDVKRDTEFWAIFSPIATQKIKTLHKWKKYLEISFYTSVTKIMITCYTVPEIWCMTDIIVTFHFGLFFALLPY